MSYGGKAKFQINRQNLDALLSKVLQKKIKQLDKEFKITLESDLFVWGSTTIRKNGDTVSDPRNAVDTGKLLRSQRVNFSKAQTGTITWSVPYAAPVFDQAKVDLVDYTLQRMRNS